MQTMRKVFADLAVTQSCSRGTRRVIADYFQYQLALVIEQLRAHHCDVAAALQDC